jgi:radical SAM superfamily enzyme YgiQ (UPF0313 family)
MKESNPFLKKYRKGMKRVALVYPNRYVGGISNLGLQHIYARINEGDAVCERFYADVFDGLRSVETATPLRDFDMALFSLQYEADYFKAVEIIRKSGFKGLTIAGGPCVMENPKPLLPYFDAFFIGEVDEKIDEIVEVKSGEELGSIEGIYTGKEEKVKRVRAKLSRHMDREIIGEGAYGRCFLLEIGRGCIRRCRFCIVRQIYFPPRWRRLEDLPEVRNVDKIALIAPSPSDNPEFKDILLDYVSKGFKVSPSSVRADTIDEELADILRRAELRTLTIAPEAASSHLMEVLNKGIDVEDVMNAAKLSAGRFDKVKLYFMVGLPNERFEDVKDILELALKVKKYVKRVEISVNPLVPKPHTPLQWLPFGGKSDVKEGIRELKKKLQYLKIESRKLGIEADVSGVREFVTQTILSRGDETVAGMLEGRGYRNFYSFLGEMDIDRILPWDFIDHGYSKDRLVKEYQNLQISLNQ